MGLKTSRNPAARAGRWSARHRKAAILGWVAFVVLAAKNARVAWAMLRSGAPFGEPAGAGQKDLAAARAAAG